MATVTNLSLGGARVQCLLRLELCSLVPAYPCCTARTLRSCSGPFRRLSPRPPAPAHLCNKISSLGWLYSSAQSRRAVPRLSPATACGTTTIDPPWALEVGLSSSLCTCAPSKWGSLSNNQMCLSPPLLPLGLICGAFAWDARVSARPMSSHMGTRHRSTQMRPKTCVTRQNGGALLAWPHHFGLSEQTLSEIWAGCVHTRQFSTEGAGKGRRSKRSAGKQRTC
jgi:hypothetical protein